MFILHAYCAGLVKACHLVNERVKEELCYEVSSASPHQEPKTLECAGINLRGGDLRADATFDGTQWPVRMQLPTYLPTQRRMK